MLIKCFFFVFVVAMNSISVTIQNQTHVHTNYFITKTNTFTSQNIYLPSSIILHLKYNLCLMLLLSNRSYFAVRSKDKNLCLKSLRYLVNLITKQWIWRRKTRRRIRWHYYYYYYYYYFDLHGSESSLNTFSDTLCVQRAIS